MDIALAVIIRDTDGSVLLTRRPQNTHLGGLWEFPGGKVESGETPADAAVREAQEEVGLTITVTQAYETITHVYADRMVTLHPFLCQAHGEAITLNGPTEYVWAAPIELDNYPMPAANSVLVARLQRKKRGTVIHPLKLVGAVLLVLGLLFRAVCIAHFRARPHSARRQRNALLWDGVFIVTGAYLILRG